MKNFLLRNLYLLLAFTVFLFSGVFLYNYYIISNTKNTVPSLSEQADYWEDVIRENPTYLDAYVELAQIELARENEERAVDLIEFANSLDPNSEKLKGYSEFLGVSSSPSVVSSVDSASGSAGVSPSPSASSSATGSGSSSF